MFGWHKRENDVVTEPPHIEEGAVDKEQGRQTENDNGNQKSYHELKSEVVVEKEGSGAKAKRRAKKFLVWFLATLIYGVLITVIPIVTKVKPGGLPTALLAFLTFGAAKSISSSID